MEREPKTKRGQRALKKKLPKWDEDTKQALFIRGPKTSEFIQIVLKELYQLKKPDAVNFTSRHNNTRPFEDEASLEFLAKKNDISLFCYGSHSKKRPDNLIFGRFYDSHLLDMFEFFVEDFKSIYHFDISTYQNIGGGTKPCLIFQGPEWEENQEFSRLKSLFFDFFRGTDLKEVDLASLESAIYFTTFNQKIFIRHYIITLKKSGTKIPRVVLEEAGPHLDLQLRRTKLPSDDLWKEALQKAPDTKLGKNKKEKNKERDLFSNQIGRIHMKQQDLSTLQTKRAKALRSRPNKKQQSTENQNDDNDASNDNDNEIDESEDVSPKKRQRVYIDNE